MKGTLAAVSDSPSISTHSLSIRSDDEFFRVRLSCLPNRRFRGLLQPRRLCQRRTTLPLLRSRPLQNLIVEFRSHFFSDCDGAFARNFFLRHCEFRVELHDVPPNAWRWSRRRGRANARCGYFLRPTGG